MKYLGSLGDLKDTMREAHESITQLGAVVGQVAALARRNSGGLGAYNTGTSQDPSYGAPTVGSVSTLPTGETQTVYDNGNVSIYNPSTGYTVTTTAAGGAQVTDSTGQVIASSGNTPTAGAVAGDAAAAAIAQPIVNAGTAAANAAGSLGSGLSDLFANLASIMKSTAGLAIVGVIAYVIFKEDK
jgi:hypothetical protein